MSSGKEVNISNDQDAQLNKDGIVMKCPYCCIKPKGLIWLAHHLAGTGGAKNPPCLKVSNNIRNLHKADLLRNAKEEDLKNANGKRMKKVSSVEDNHSRSEKIVTITENDSKEAKMTIARFFHENRLDANVVTSPSFLSMISLAPELLQHQIAMHEDLRDWISDLNRIDDYINELKISWAETGCSVLLDFWADEMGHSLVNVLVDSPRGTVCISTNDISDLIGNINAMMLFIEQIVLQVGLRNVVQVITNSTSDFMKELGKCFMAKHRSVFWTVSISSCIDLMLKKMGALNLFEKTFENAKSITRFIHSRPEVSKLFKDLTNGQNLVRPSKKSFLPFLILENIISDEKSLRLIFESSELDLVSSSEGKRVAHLVLGRSFWSAALVVVKATIPLVRLMDWMDMNKLHVGCVYETLEQAKEAIRDGLKESRDKIEDIKWKKYGYQKFWEMVDEVWNSSLHSHLHSAGYFLNPEIYYSSNANLDSEICLGMAWCVMRSTEFAKVQDVMTQQLEMYRNSIGKFGEGCGIRERKAVLPAIWWEKYGGEHPEIQQFAIRILSQTCDGASKFRLKRSLAENLVIKGRDPVEQQKLSEWFFSQYNMVLKTFVPGKCYCPSADEIAVMDDWILDKSEAGTSQQDENKRCKQRALKEDV